MVHGDGTLRGWGELPLEPPNEAPRFKGGFFIGGSGRKGGSGEAAAIQQLAAWSQLLRFLARLDIEVLNYRWLDCGRRRPTLSLR